VWQPLKYEHVMKVVVSVVNLIRFHGLNYRQFESFLSEIDDEYGYVFYRTEVRSLNHVQTFCTSEARNRTVRE